MNLSTRAHMFYGANIDIQRGVEWDTLASDIYGGIKMIHYGSDGDSMYAVAIAESVTTVELGALALPVATATHKQWFAMVRAFCSKHGLGLHSPEWRLAVESF